MRINLAVILFLCYILPAGTWAQENSYRFSNFNYKDGLKDKFFYDITADNSGMLWIASGSGIYNYDGVKFTLYKSNLIQSESSSNFINTIYKDSKGQIWCSGINSFQWFLPTTKKFYYYSPAVNGFSELGHAFINQFFEDSQGNMWAATQKSGIAFINTKDSAVRFLRRDIKKGSSVNYTNAIVETPDSKLFAATANGIVQFSRQSGIEKVYYFSTGGKNPDGENFYLGAFYDRDYNCIWLNTLVGIAQFFPETGIIKHHYVHNPTNDRNVTGISAICNKSKHELWFCDGNLCVFDKSTATTVSRITPNANSEYGFSNTIIKKIHSDIEGNIWLCAFNGLSMLPWQNNQWKTLPLEDNAKHTTIEPLTLCDVPGTTNLLISSQYTEGLCNIDVTTGEMNFYPLRKGNEMLAVTAICRNKDRIYVAAGNDIYLFDYKSGKYQPFQLQFQNAPLQGPFWRINCDVADMIYVASPQNGFYKININTKKVQHFDNWDIDKSVNKGAEENNLLPSFIDSRGSVWLTRSSALYCMMANGTIIKFPQANFIHEVVEDNQGHYWLTSKANGITELWPEANGAWRKRRFHTGNTPKLPNDYVMRVVKDRDGMLWFGTLSGLVKMDPIKREIIATFRKKHGLRNDNVDVAIGVVQNNKIVVNNYGALNIMQIDSYRKNKFAPSVLITSFKVMDREIEVSPNTDTTIILPHTENFLQFTLAATTYNNSDENTYSYKLDGADKNWILSNRNFVSYSGLKDGEYTFKAKCANNDGLWSEQEKTLRIIIKPPFWKTWWFILGIVALISGLVAAWYKLKINQIKKEEALKATFTKQLADIEMKALRAQMNPHFIFNSLNSIQKYILDKDSFTASQYLTRFSRLIRLILNQSNQNMVLLSTEIEMLQLYIDMETMRFDGKFNYNIKVDEHVDTNTIEIPSMLIQPFVENAIWHGLLHKNSTGNLGISFTKPLHNMLVVSIEDDGIGRERAAELKSKQVLKNKSFGMQITGNRMDLIGRLTGLYSHFEISDLKGPNGEAKGTRVTLNIPLNK